MSIRVGIVGISGFGGGEAMRLVASHPFSALPGVPSGRAERLASQIRRVCGGLDPIEAWAYEQTSFVDALSVPLASLMSAAG